MQNGNRPTSNESSSPISDQDIHLRQDLLHKYMQQNEGLRVENAQLHQQTERLIHDHERVCRENDRLRRRISYDGIGPIPDDELLEINDTNGDPKSSSAEDSGTSIDSPDTTVKEGASNGLSIRNGNTTGQAISRTSKIVNRSFNAANNNKQSNGKVGNNRATNGNNKETGNDTGLELRGTSAATKFRAGGRK